MTGARPIVRDPQSAEGAVLLLHGILSAPQFFDFLLPVIPEQCAVSAPLFEGHGGEVSGLYHTSLSRWRRQAKAAFRRLQERYGRVCIIAHSMGTLFALELALRYPEAVPDMLLLNMPLYAHLTAEGAWRSLQIGMNASAEGSPELAAAKRAYFMQPDSFLPDYLGWLPRYLELFREMETVRGLLPQFHGEAAVFQSARDELVSPRSDAVLRQHPSFRCGLLRESTHFYYSPQDAQEIRQTAAQCIRNSITRGEEP